MTEQDKVTVDDIIGIVKTEEQTNSVEEVRKLRGRGNETAKRFMVDDAGTLIDMQTRDMFDIVEEVVDLLNDFDEYIKELKQEVKLLRDGLKAYDENLPLYLTCKEIRDFNSDLFEFTIKRQEFYNEHPRLCKIIVDGKELEE